MAKHFKIRYYFLVYSKLNQQVSGSNEDTEPFKTCYSSYFVCVFKIDKHWWKHLLLCRQNKALKDQSKAWEDP